MRLRFYTVVVDSRDHRALARWWADALEWVIVYEDDFEASVIPPEALDEESRRRLAEGDGLTAEGLEDARVPAERWAQAPPGLVFCPVPEAKTIKNRLHIDLAPHLEDDRDAQIQRLLDAGATRVDVGQDDSVTWDVLADPEGNEFCVLSSRDR